jgi:hypothetical protein
VFCPVETAAALRVERSKNASIYWLKVVSLTFASWNQIDEWLRRADGIRRAA